MYRKWFQQYPHDSLFMINPFVIANRNSDSLHWYLFMNLEGTP